MHVWNGLAEVPADLPATVVSIGVFDGVHRGHQEILSSNVRAAKKRGALAVALTFDPHPAQVHRPEAGVALIASLADRLDSMAQLGLDAVVVQPYTLDFARQSGQEFIREVLVGTLHAAQVVVGQDVRFGRDNAGDGALLISMGEELGFDVEIVSDLRGDISGRRWSSTWVRELLAAGDVRRAAVVLGRPHRLRGVVQHGFKRGRELGYPTANLDPDDLGVVPPDGVYAGWLIRPFHEGADDAPGGDAGRAAGSGAGGLRSRPGGGLVDRDGHHRLPAAISIGTNPQFDGPTRTVEAHVLGRTDLDLYGEEVVVELVEYLRPMLAFDDLDGLLVQMRADIERAAAILEVPVPEPLDPQAVTAGT